MIADCVSGVPLSGRVIYRIWPYSTGSDPLKLFPKHHTWCW